MNIRKSTDYSVMYAELDEISSKNLPLMEEIYAIGCAICKRSEKGAAVMAEEYLQTNYPERTGFSPRNVRRMREFYRTYENDETLLRLAMKIGWTLNVVIMEAELTRTERKWYLEQAEKQCWSKGGIMNMKQKTLLLSNVQRKTFLCHLKISMVKRIIRRRSLHYAASILCR